jgi:hypothetical protein
MTCVEKTAKFGLERDFAVSGVAAGSRAARSLPDVPVPFFFLCNSPGK